MWKIRRPQWSAAVLPAATAALLLRLIGCALAGDPTSGTLREAIFVTNMGGNYVTIYDLKSTRDVPPLGNVDGTFVDRVFSSVVQGASGLDDPSGVALDPAGNIYVANMSGGGSYTGTIVVFRAGAHGSAKPIAKIDGPDTGLYTLKAIAVDSTGNIYATRQGYDYGGSPPGINMYSAGSTGNIKPTAVISGPNTGIENLEGIAVDSKGSIYVTNNGDPGSVLVFPPGSNGDVKPSDVIVGRSNTALAALTLDSSGNIYAVRLNGTGRSRSQSVVIYRAGSNGDVPPVATISGPKTGLAEPNYTIRGMAVDSSGNIYVAGEIASWKKEISRIIVYGAGSDGDVPPRAIIEGPHTKLYGAFGIAVGPYSGAR